MIEKLIEKAKGKYEFLVTHAFDTGEFLSQTEFFRRMGFREITRENLYYSFIRRELKEPYYGFWREELDAGEWIPINSLPTETEKFRDKIKNALELKS